MRRVFVRDGDLAMRDRCRSLRSSKGPVGVLAILLASGFGGCVQDLAQAKIEPGGGQGPVASVSGRTAVALASIDGAPEPLMAHFKEAVATEAAGREISFTDPSLARYLVRGYLDAYATETGTAVHYVWDVFDARKQRLQRFDDGLDIPGTNADPWSALDDKVLAAIASRSAQSIAAYLATTSEQDGSPSTTRASNSSEGAAAQTR